MDYMAVSRNWGSFLVGVYITRALVLGVYIGAPDSWTSKFPEIPETFTACRSAVVGHYIIHMIISTLNLPQTSLKEFCTSLQDRTQSFKKFLIGQGTGAHQEPKKLGAGPNGWQGLVPWRLLCSSFLGSML